jgi:hypothetical protein
MTPTRRFDEQTRWDHDPGGLRAGGAGWAAPGQDFFIDRADPYWGRVLNKARSSYGDPNMHYSTDSVGQQRALVFGDGTPVPADGSLAYRNTANGSTYLLNDDGTVSLLGANGPAGQPIMPAAFRRNPDGGYAPLDASGHQLAPLLNSAPPAPNGYYDHNGVLTPKNARGDCYVDDPATGMRAYFDATGRPITEQQFRDGAPAPGPTVGPPLATDAQQSGRAADAVKKLHQDLQSRYSQISDAEGTLSEVLLTAHATTADGQQKLQQIQQKIVEAINNPDLSVDTPAGEQAFLKFLRGQVTAIGDVLKSGTLTAQEQSKAIEALSNLYALDPGSTAGPVSPGEPTATTTEQPGAPPDLGREEPMPDPTLSDLGSSGLGTAGTAAPAGVDPLSSLGSALPAAMGAFPPGGLGGGFGADPLSSLGGLAAPLAGLASQLGDHPRRDNPDGSADTARAAGNSPDKNADSGPKQQEPQPDRATQPPPAQPEPKGIPGEGAPPAAPATPPVPTTTVALPDGSTANAKTAALAQAVKAHLAGTPVDAAYRGAGIELPPPGTPVTNPVDPSALSCGSIGMFADHYVVALSSAKALQDGQVVPLSSVASGPGFLGWMDPSAAPVTPPAPAASPAAPPG